MSGYILLVDDNPHNLRLLIAILREKGYQIRPATSGARALTMIAREKPDLVLLDINMPEMDGYEVCRRIKADPATHDIPVLFISASDEIVDKLKGFEAGAIDYITKPFQEAEVLARISTQMTILRQRRQLESVLDSSRDGIMAYEAVRDGQQIVDFRWLMLNPAAALLLGADSSQLSGRLLLECFPWVQTIGLFLDYVQVVESGQPLDKEYYIEAWQVWIHISAVRLEDGLAVTFRNITERKQMELELARLAQSDGLTGIPNRRVFDQVLLREWKRCLRDQQPLALIICDIDYFKRYNDFYGHLQGDACLRSVAEAIQKAVRRPGDLAARYGGEEFTAILPNTDAQGALEVARLMAAGVSGLHLPHATSGSGEISLSIGVAVQIPAADQIEQDLLQAADQALYAAKEKGRSRIELATSEEVTGNKDSDGDAEPALLGL